MQVKLEKTQALEKEAENIYENYIPDQFRQLEARLEAMSDQYQGAKNGYETRIAFLDGTLVTYQQVISCEVSCTCFQREADHLTQSHYHDSTP